MISELIDTQRERERERARRESDLKEWTSHRTTAPTLDVLARSRRPDHAAEIMPHEACRRLTGLVAHDPPMTNLSLSRSPSPFPFPFPSICNHSLFLLPLSLTEFLSLTNGFVSIFVSLSLFIEIFYYKIYLEAKKIAEKIWGTSRKIAFLEYNKIPVNIFQNNFHNAVKHLKIFSFPQNIFTWKYFTPSQRQP